MHAGGRPLVRRRLGVHRPGEASKHFEASFGAGDLEALMELYEQDAVFTNASGAHVGPEAIRSVLRGYLDTGASIRMNDPVAFEAGDLALAHWSWTMTFPDGRAAEGATAEVLRRQADGSWRLGSRAALQPRRPEAGATSLHRSLGACVPLGRASPNEPRR